jgi:hypothetical protein
MQSTSRGGNRGLSRARVCDHFMCGRALEAICRHYGTQDTYLGASLKELRDKGIIDYVFLLAMKFAIITAV